MWTELTEAAAGPLPVVTENNSLWARGVCARQRKPSCHRRHVSGHISPQVAAARSASVGSPSGDTRHLRLQAGERDHGTERSRSGGGSVWQVQGPFTLSSQQDVSCEPKTWTEARFRGAAAARGRCPGPRARLQAADKGNAAKEAETLPLKRKSWKPGGGCESCGAEAGCRMRGGEQI